jgi:NNP family nitrate/nitrite transporter-like MFS transporter
LTNDQVANSNILGLSSTVFVRLIAGYLCDEFGPRITMAIILLLGAAPTACAFLVKDATGFYLVRFCIGILGGSFVPCQVWTTAFYDKSVVGTANALAGGTIFRI